MTTQQAMDKLLQKEKVTRGDIALLLSTMKTKPKGEKREKVKELMNLVGHPSSNFQGHLVEDTLDGYEDY